MKINIDAKKSPFKKAIEIANESDRWLELLLKHINRIVIWGLFMLGVIAFGRFAKESMPYFPEVARWFAVALSLLFGLALLTIICLVGGVDVTNRIIKRCVRKKVGYLIGIIFGLVLAALGSGELVFAEKQLLQISPSIKM